MSNICATILAIASLIGIFVACAVKEPGIMIFLCVIFTLLCTDAVRQKKEDVEDKDDEKRSPLLGEKEPIKKGCFTCAGYDHDVGWCVERGVPLDYLYDDIKCPYWSLDEEVKTDGSEEN